VASLPEEDDLLMLRTLRHQKLKGLRASSRRRRRNPDAPYGVLPAKWKEALERGKAEARAMLLGVREELVRAGVPPEALPEPADLNKASPDVGALIVSSEYADLAAQSKLDTPSKQVAAQVFSLFDKVAEEKAAKPVLTTARRTFANRLDTLRTPALAKRKAAGGQVRAAQAQAAEETEEQLRRELEEVSRRIAEAEGRAPSTEEEEEDDLDDEGDEADEIDEMYEQAKAARKRAGKKTPEPIVRFIEAYEAKDDLDAIMDAYAAVQALAAGAPEVEQTEEVVEERVERRRPSREPRAPAEPRARRPRSAPRAAPREEIVEEEDEEIDIPSVEVSRSGERLAGYGQFRTRVRKTTVNDPSYRPPPDALRRETARDILLYVLTDRTTQVWIKGALTETFTGSRGRASWKVAAAYAKNWLETPGATGGIKKSRLGTRVVASTEDEPEKFEVVVAARTGTGAAAPKKLESLATIAEQLRAEPKSRSNPRYCREGYLRNPMGRQVVADVREVFRRANISLSVAQGNQMPTTFSPVLRNGRKLPVPEYVAKTPRKAGERISAVGVKGAWPIGDLFHARLAAIYIMSPSHRAKKAQVLRALETHWPQYDWRAFIGEKPLRMVANPRMMRF